MGSFFEAAEKQKRHRCFMDGIDWQHHLEMDAQGTLLFPSEKSLTREAGHSLDECGIVEVEVRLIRWTTPQNLPRPPKKAALDGDGR